MKAALIFIGIIISSVLTAKLQAQGTAFTYQGQLAINGLPASGNYDFVFSLNDSSNAGNYLGSSVTNSSVVVTNGLFTAILDFGQVFNGSERWLDISVRTNGASNFTTLSPRQQLTPVPYAITASNALTAATITSSLPDSSLSGVYGGQVTLNNSSDVFSGTFSGNGGGLTNLPFAKTFFSTNGFFTFTQNPDGSTNVTFVFTNGTPAEVGAQPASGNLTVLASNNGVALTNLPFAKTFFSTNGFFTFTQNADGSTNVTFVFTNGTPAEVGAQPASGNLTALAVNNGVALTNLPFAKTFASTNGFFTFTKNLDGSTNVTFVFTNGTPAEVGAQPANASLTALAANNGVALTNLPFAKTFFSTNGFFTFTKNLDGSTNVTFVFTNGTPTEVGAQPASASLTALAANNGVVLTNLPFAKTFFSTNGFFTFTQNADGSTNVTFVFTNGTPAEVGAQPASGNLTALAANNGVALTNLPFAKTFTSTNGFYTFTANPDGSTNVTFVFTNGTPAEVGAQPANSNLNLLAANNGASLTNLPFAKTFTSTNGFFTFTQNADGSTNVTFVFTNGTPAEVGAQSASASLTALASNNGVALTNLPFAKTFASTNGFFTFTANPDGSTNVTFVFTNGTPAEVGAQPASASLTALAANNGVALTNLPFAKTFTSTNGFFTFTANPDGSTNVTFVFTNGTPAEVGAQPASASLTVLAANNGAALTNLPFAKTFFSTNGFFTFTQNSDGSTNVTFVFTNGTPAEVGAQPASASLTVLAANNGAALTNLPFAKTFFSTNGFFTFTQNSDGSTNVTFVFTNGTPAEVGAQPASGNLTALAVNNGTSLTNLPFAKTFTSTNGFFTFTQNADGSTNVTFVFTNGTPAEVGAQPASGSLTLLAANNGATLTNLPFAKTFTSTNGFFTFTANPDGSTNVTFVFTNGTPAEVGAQPASGSLTLLAANNGATLTNLPFAKTFTSTNGFFTFTANPDGSTNVTFVFTNGTPAEVGAQPASGNLTALAANNGVALTNLPFAKTFTSNNGFYTFTVNPDGSTNVTFVFTNGTPAEVGAQPASASLTALAANNGVALTNLPFAKTFASTNGFYTFTANPDGSTNVTFVFTNGTPAEVGAQPASGNLTALAANNGVALTNLPFAKTFASTNGFFTFTQNPDGSTNVTFVFTNGTPAEVGAQPANNNLDLLAASNGSGLTNLPFAETFSSVNGYFNFSQNPDGSTNVTFVFTNGTPGEVGAQPTNSNLTLLSGNNGAALTNDLRSLAVYVNSNYLVSASELSAMQTTNIVYYIDTTSSNILFTFPTPLTSANVSFSIVNFGTNSIVLTNQPGSTFEIANGYSGVSTNEIAIGGYFDKVTVWQNFNGTNWVQLANHRTVQEIRDIAAAYIGMTNGMSENLAVNNNLAVNGVIFGNGSGLTNLPFAKTFSSTNGYFAFAQNPDGSTNVTFVLTNLGAQIITGTLSGMALPLSVVLTNGASAVGQVPTWNGSNYVWASGSGGGGIVSNTAVTFSSISTTNPAANNLFPGYVTVGTTNGATGGLILNAGITSSNQFILNNRAVSDLPGLPVATLSPVNAASPFALDLMPSAGASAFPGAGVTWIDLCSTNCLTNEPPLSTLRLLEQPNGNAYVGTIGLNGMTGGGLSLGYNNSSLLQINNNGLVAFANFGPNATTLYNLGNGVEFFNTLFIKTIVFTNSSSISSLASPGTVLITTNLIVSGSLTVTNTASIKTNTAAFNTLSAPITLGSTFTNLMGGRADFVGQFTFNGSGTGTPILVVSNLTSGLVITNGFPITSGAVMQSVILPDTSPNDACEAYDASTGTGASITFVRGWWIVK